MRRVAESLMLLGLLAGCIPEEQAVTRLVCARDQLCDGYRTTGRTRVETTWHPDDKSVVLVDDDATLIARTQDFARCMEAMTTVRIDADTVAHFQIHIVGHPDGRRDFTLPAGGWRSLSFPVNLPEDFVEVQLRISKEGPGEVGVMRLHPENCQDGSSSREYGGVEWPLHDL